MLVLLLLGPQMVLCASATAAGPVVTVDDHGGAWWFQGERVIVAGNISSVAVGFHVSTSNPVNGNKVRCTLNGSASVWQVRPWYDDDKAPAFVLSPDGRMLAMFTQHGADAVLDFRISVPPGDRTAWGEEQALASAAAQVTDSNLGRLSARRMAATAGHTIFFRELDDRFKPSSAYSNELGETSLAGNILIALPTKFEHGPCVRYDSNSTSTVHLAYTDSHPANIANSVYHFYYRSGELRRSDDKVTHNISEAFRALDEETRIFAADTNDPAWVKATLAVPRLHGRMSCCTDYTVALVVHRQALTTLGGKFNVPEPTIFSGSHREGWRAHSGLPA